MTCIELACSPMNRQRPTYHRTEYCSKTSASGRIRIYSTSLQPALELPHSAEGEPAEGGDTHGGGRCLKAQRTSNQRGFHWAVLSPRWVSKRGAALCRFYS